jgi:hypothetical protein
MMRAPCGRRAFAPRHIYGSVAQLVEQYPFKVLVLGSSPSRPNEFIDVFSTPSESAPRRRHAGSKSEPGRVRLRGLLYGVLEQGKSLDP